MKGIELKAAFFSHFKKDGFEFIAGSSVVPDEDKSIMFTPAGMVQFKKILLNQEEVTKTLVYNTQKCIRAGGKHNDLDDVGFDVYHHTFFEMLGTFSFGECNRHHMIETIWRFLTKTLNLDPNNIYITYFKGDEKLGLKEDIETKQIWQEFTDKIIPCTMKDNFWGMGDTGVCGPCTEIHYDKKGGRDASDFVNTDDPNVVEIWNIVFMQLNRTSLTEFIPLEKCHIDTGCGFERLLSVVQKKLSNYDTDLFTDIISAIDKQVNRSYWSVGKEKRRLYRTIADHARTIAVALHDNVSFGANGRQGVLRKIFRRAVYALRYRLGGYRFYDIVNVAAVSMETYGVFVDINKVVAIAQDEEKQTIIAFDRSIRIAMTNQNKNKFDLAKAIQLYTSEGLLREMIVQMSEQQQLCFTIEDFDTAIVEQK